MIAAETQCTRRMSDKRPTKSVARLRKALEKEHAPGICRHLYRDTSADPCTAGVKQQLAAVRMLFDWLTKRAEVTFSGVPDIAAVIAAVGVAGYECMVENANSSNLI
jgi:hypothetical protein